MLKQSLFLEMRRTRRTMWPFLMPFTPYLSQTCKKSYWYTSKLIWKFNIPVEIYEWGAVQSTSDFTISQSKWATKQTLNPLHANTRYGCWHLKPPKVNWPSLISSCLHSCRRITSKWPFKKSLSPNLQHFGMAPISQRGIPSGVWHISNIS